jgi:hypothetical protein
MIIIIFFIIGKLREYYRCNTLPIYKRMSTIKKNYFWITPNGIIEKRKKNLQSLLNIRRLDVYFFDLAYDNQ